MEQDLRDRLIALETLQSVTDKEINKLQSEVSTTRNELNDKLDKLAQKWELSSKAQGEQISNLSTQISKWVGALSMASLALPLLVTYISKHLF